MEDSRIAHQPLHPSVLDIIDPDYRRFHEEFLQYKVPSQYIPWSPSAREGPLMPGNDAPVPVGETKRLKFSQCTALCWIPEGSAPREGWSVLVYFHGGGVGLSITGMMQSDCIFSGHCRNRKMKQPSVPERVQVSQLSQLQAPPLTESADTPCVVISVDYRLAPEHPYPAPIEDAEEILRWVSTEGVSSLKINKDKIAIGGLSASALSSANLHLLDCMSCQRR